MLPTAFDDATLNRACWESTARQMRGRSMEIKQAVYDQQSPSRRAFFLFNVVWGHSEYGVLHLLGVLEPVVAQPGSWQALRGGFAFFGATGMIELLGPMAELHRMVLAGASDTPEVVTAAREIDAVLPGHLADALQRVASYIRSHPAEFAEA